MLFVCYTFLSETDSWSFGLAGYGFLGNPIGGFMSVNGILQSHWQSLQSPAQKFITGPAHFTSPAVISFMVASRNHSLSLVSVNHLQCLCSSSREIRSKNIDLTQIFFNLNFNFFTFFLFFGGTKKLPYKSHLVQFTEELN